MTPICAIGASAGGVQALRDLFRHLPKDLGLAYVVIIHLSPDHPSAMQEILATVTEMPVHQVTDTPELKPNCIYVIPPDRELVIEGDHVQARPFSEPRGQRAPIDMLFRSIATGRGDGLAVVLSGAGSDGANGVRAVKEAGGVIFVQEPAEAEYPMMPRSAIATGAADFVAPIETMVERLIEVTHSKAAVRAIHADANDHELRRILSFLRSRTGHDFSSYKRATIMRRIGRRMQVTRRPGLREYSEFLIANPEEAQELFDDLLISVTSFFRDPAAYKALADEAIGPMFEEGGENGIRAWVVGCATGEEAYSLAMLLLEAAASRRVSTPIQIFASDLDEGALATAREGRYPASIEADVSEERLTRWFVREGRHYRIKQEVRDIVLFASHSVLKEPPFIRLDLVSCRNLLIYLERELQRQVCTLFHYGLRPHGFLFLGSAETVEAAPDSFFAINREARIYRARPMVRRSMLVLPSQPTGHRPTVPATRGNKWLPDRHLLPQEDRTAGAAHVAALERTAPPSAMVDHDHNMLHLSSRAGRFLLTGGGPFTTDIVSQVRPELRLDLAGALRRALEYGEPTLTLPVPVAFNGSARRVLLHVAPVPEEKGAPIRRAIVYFLDGGPAKDSQAEPAAIDGANVSRRLRDELRQAEERLKLSRTEHENALQDLRIGNEELQSINEEYRSTSEELETSKEELQSMNEELQTVNNELKSKLESISTAHSDLRNLVASTEIGTLFLDPELRIRMFTPAVADLFSVTEADVGRRITDFTHRLDKDGLDRDADRVLRTLAPHEEEVASRDGRWMMMRLRPYRTVDDRIDGLVVTFFDITARKLAEEALADELKAVSRLQEISTRAVRAGELEGPLGALLDAAIELLGADLGNIQLFDPGAKVLRIAVQRSFDQAFLERFAEVDADEPSACGFALADRHLVMIEDVETDPRYALARDAAKAAGYRAVLSVPLFTTGGDLVGVLSTHFREVRRLSGRDRRLIAIYARQAADAIDAYQLQARLRASELRLRKVLETEAVGVLFFDDAGTGIDANEAFLRMTGYTREQVQRGALSWQSLTPPEHLPQSEAQLQKLQQTDSIGPYEKEYLCADGTKRWMLFAGRRIEPNLISEYVIDITDKRRSEEERELLARELSHRVKNTLAVVQALARQTRANSVEEYRDAFVGRLKALANGHGLLLQSDWQSAELGALVNDAMAAYGDDASRVRIEGAPITVPAKQALSLSLVLHELATNALKYGSLSAQAGTVRIAWSARDGDGGTRIRLVWQERGGPAVKPPSEGGFGMELIRQALTYELDGTGQAEWAQDGLTYEIEFPKE